MPPITAPSPFRFRYAAATPHSDRENQQWSAVPRKTPFVNTSNTNPHEAYQAGSSNDSRPLKEHASQRFRKPGFIVRPAPRGVGFGDGFVDDRAGGAVVVRRDHDVLTTKNVMRRDNTRIHLQALNIPGDERGGAIAAQHQLECTSTATVNDAYNSDEDDDSEMLQVHDDDSEDAAIPDAGAQGMPPFNTRSCTTDDSPTRRKRRRLLHDAQQVSIEPPPGRHKQLHQPQTSSPNPQAHPSPAPPPPETPCRETPSFQMPRHLQHTPRFNIRPSFTFMPTPNSSSRTHAYTTAQPHAPSPSTTTATTITLTTAPPPPPRPRHRRFLLPPSTPSSTDSLNNTNTDLGNIGPPPILLPDAFSPHRRKERFIPGGWAAQMRGWLVEMSSFTSTGVGSSREEGGIGVSALAAVDERGGAVTICEVVDSLEARIAGTESIGQVDRKRSGTSDPMMLVRGQHVTPAVSAHTAIITSGHRHGEHSISPMRQHPPIVNIVLVGGTTDCRSLNPRDVWRANSVVAGARVRISAPVWEIELDIAKDYGVHGNQRRRVMHGSVEDGNANTRIGRYGDDKGEGGRMKWIVCPVWSLG